MVTSTFSSSSLSSISSLDDSSVRSGTSSSSSTTTTTKFLCSYGGRIVPRYPDGRLRYVGGETRVLSVDRSVPFSELLVKMADLCGWEVEGMHLRCQLPTEDLEDALISITSDEDLSNLIEEYDLANRDRASPLKIRAFLLYKSPSPPLSAASSPPSPVKGKLPSTQPPPSSHRRFSPPSTVRSFPCHNHHSSHQQKYLGGYGGGIMPSPYRSHAGSSGHPRLVHNGNFWQ